MEEKNESISRIAYKLEYKKKSMYGNDTFISEPKELIEHEKEIEKLKLKSDEYHSFKIYEIITEGTQITKLYKDFDKVEDEYNEIEKAQEVLDILKDNGINLETLNFNILEQILKESYSEDKAD
jgi:esterase/lipase